MRVVEVPPGLELRFPTGSCCNCGAAEGLEPVETPLLLTRFFGAGGVQYRLTRRDGRPYAIEHCGACRPTATRLRHGVTGHLVAFAATSVLAGILVACGLLAAGAERLEHAFWAGPALAAAALAGWGATRRPPGGARTYRQAVWVMSLDQRFSGELLCWRLGVANDGFAARLVGENPELKGS